MTPTLTTVLFVAFIFAQAISVILLCWWLTRERPDKGKSRWKAHDDALKKDD